MMLLDDCAASAVHICATVWLVLQEAQQHSVSTIFCHSIKQMRMKCTRLVVRDVRTSTKGEQQPGHGCMIGRSCMVQRC